MSECDTVFVPVAEPIAAEQGEATGRRAAKFAPTPSQKTRSKVVLPTPETVRRPRKVQAEDKDKQPTRTAGKMPTPRTLPRSKRVAQTVDSAISPEGYTTFSHTSNADSQSNIGGNARRRPGLTFAQQMGLASGRDASKSSGIGRGMGGHKSSSHAVDRIAAKNHPQADDNPFVVEDNPFLVSPFKAQKVSPLFAPFLSNGIESPQHGATTPPPRLTQPPAEPTSPTVSRYAAAHARDRQAESARRRQMEAKRKEMLDEDNNPFLLKPGETVQPKPHVDDAKQPFVTYVFRGTKRIFANPFIPSDSRLPNAELHPDDDDFDEHPCPKPRLLWPTNKTPQPSNTLPFDEETTPSPPSSPILRTPQTRPRAPVHEADGEGIVVPESHKRKADTQERHAPRRAKVNRRL